MCFIRQKAIIILFFCFLIVVIFSLSYSAEDKRKDPEEIIEFKFHDEDKRGYIPYEWGKLVSVLQIGDKNPSAYLFFENEKGIIRVIPVDLNLSRPSINRRALILYRNQ